MNDKMKAEWDLGGVKDRRDEALVLANMCTVIRTMHIKYFIIVCNCVCLSASVCKEPEQIIWQGADPSRLKLVA